MCKRKVTSALLTAATAAILSGQAASASTIAQWTYQGDTIGTNNTPAADVGTGASDAIGFTNSYNNTTSVNTDDVLLGTTKDTGTNTEADLTNVWRVRGQTPGNGWSSSAPIATQGAQYATSTVGYAGPITVSFDWYDTTQGEGNLQLEYTDNGTTFINVPISVGANSGITAKTNSSSTNTVTGSYVQAGAQDWFQGLTATIADPLAAGNSAFEIELVNASTGADDVSAAGTPLNNSSGNWRFDNVSISGTIVPEPATLSLVGLAGLALLKRGRRSAESK